MLEHYFGKRPYCAQDALPRRGPRTRPRRRAPKKRAQPVRRALPETVIVDRGAEDRAATCDAPAQVNVERDQLGSHEHHHPQQATAPQEVTISRSIISADAASVTPVRHNVRNIPQ